MSKEIKVNDTTQQIGGNVTIKVKQGKKTIKTVKVHNTATVDLLYEMLLSLSGNIDTNKLPRYISVGTGSSKTTWNQTSLVAEITTTRTLLTPNYKGAPSRNSSIINEGASNEETIGYSSVKYQGIIPYSILGITENIKEIGLFGTQTGNSLLARIVLDGTSISVDMGQSLIIEWEFKIQNQVQ